MLKLFRLFTSFAVFAALWQSTNVFSQGPKPVRVGVLGVDNYQAIGLHATIQRSESYGAIWPAEARRCRLCRAGQARDIPRER